MTKLASYRLYFCVTCRSTLRGFSSYRTHVKTKPDHTVPGFVLICGRRHCPDGQCVHTTHEQFIKAHGYHIRELGGDPKTITNGTLTQQQKHIIAAKHLVTTGTMMRHGSNSIFSCPDEYRAVFNSSGISHQPPAVSNEAPAAAVPLLHNSSPDAGDSFLNFAWREAAAVPTAICGSSSEVAVQQNYDSDGDDFACPPPATKARLAPLKAGGSGPRSKEASAGAVPLHPIRRVPLHPIRPVLTMKVPLSNPSKCDVAYAVSKKRFREACRDIFGSDSEASFADADDEAGPKRWKSIPKLRFPSSHRKSGLTQEPLPLACSTQQLPCFEQQNRRLPTLSHSSLCVTGLTPQPLPQACSTQQLPSSKSPSSHQPTLPLQRTDSLQTPMIPFEEPSVFGSPFKSTAGSPFKSIVCSPLQSVVGSPLQLSLGSPLQSSVGSPLQDEGTVAPQMNLPPLPYPPPVLQTGVSVAVAPLPAVLTALLEGCSRSVIVTHETNLASDPRSGCSPIPTAGIFVVTGDEDLFADSQPANTPDASPRRVTLDESSQDVSLTHSSPHLTQWNVQTQEECIVETPASSVNSSLDEQRRRAFGMVQALSQEVLGGVLSSFVAPPTAANSDAYTLFREHLHNFNNSDLMLLINDIVQELGKRIN